MTVSNQVTKNQYTANGTNTSFSYGFKIFDEADVIVYADSALQTLNSDYTVTGVEDEGGGTVVFTTAPSSGVIITVAQGTPFKQSTSYLAADEPHEEGLDKLTLETQRLKEESDRSLKVQPYTDQNFDADLPDVSGNGSKYLRVKSNELGFEYASVSGGVGGSGLSSVNSVQNDGGNIDIISSDGSLSISGSDVNDQIDISVVDSGLVSVAGVSNAGGDVTFTAGTGLTITPDDTLNEITFNASAPNSIDGVSNAGGNIDLVEGSNITITPNDGSNNITIATSAEINTSSNVGAGSNVFKQKAGVDFEFRSVVGGDGITATENTNDVTFSFDGSEVSIADLSDVDTVAPSHNDVLKYDTVSGTYKAAATGALTAAIDDLTDVTVGGATSDGTVYGLEYDSVAGGYDFATIPGSVSAIDDLSDVDTSTASPTNGQVLKWDTVTSAWEPENVGSLTAALDDLTNVNASSPDTGSYMHFDGTNWEVRRDIFNVKDFGATGDGSTDDTSAINTAITALEAATRGGVLYFPTGDYKITSALTITQASDAMSIIVQGDGEEATRLRFIGAINGLKLETTTSSQLAGDKSCMIVKDLSLKTDNAGSNTGLWFSGATSQTIGTAPLTTIQNVALAGATAADYWGTAILIDELSFNKISHCTITGETGATAGAWNGTGIKISGQGVESPSVSHPVDHFITDCHFHVVDTAIEVIERVEGVYVDQIAVVSCQTGVYWHTNSAANLPLLTVAGSHINASSYCIRVEEIAQFNFSDNLLYANENGTTWVGVQLTNVNAGATGGGIVHDNIFIVLSGPTTINGIVLTDADYCTITGNKIDGCDTGVWAKSGSDNNVILDNYVTNFSANEVLDDGSNNKVRLVASSSSFRGALGYRTGSQSISNASDQTLVWQAEDYDTSSFIATGSGTISIPSGVTRVRITAQVRWQSGVSAGDRRLIIKKGGSSSYVGVGNNVTPSGITANIRQAAQTGIIDVTSSDTFTVVVRQNSGSAINVESTNSETWVQVEVIE